MSFQNHPLHGFHAISTGLATDISLMKIETITMKRKKKAIEYNENTHTHTNIMNINSSAKLFYLNRFYN